MDFIRYQMAQLAVRNSILEDQLKELKKGEIDIPQVALKIFYSALSILKAWWLNTLLNSEIPVINLASNLKMVKSRSPEFYEHGKIGKTFVDNSDW